jgi:hypothetical protein
MTETIPDTKLGQEGVGYCMAAFISKEGVAAVDAFRDELGTKLPPDLLWRTPSDVLHATLFEPVMLYRGYDANKDEWFADNKAHIISALGEILTSVPPIEVRFNQIEVSQNAVIIKGTDNGTFNKVRKLIESAGIIMPGSRIPPDIIHSSIFRYTRPYDLDEVHKAFDGLDTDFTMTVSEFCLERVGIVPMADLQRIATFHLG